jgi:dihydroxyacetone kinase-like protein
VTGSEVGSLFTRLAALFETEQGRLGRLDAAGGDGDHGAGMARGIAAAAAAVEAVDDAPGALFTKAGRALMSAVGGASGPLFATVLLEIGRALGDAETVDTAPLADGVAAGAAKIQKLGRSAPGDKTLLEALLPAAEALDGGRDEPLPVALAEAAKAAEAGVRASADLPARRGRARYIEGAGVGHPDPGATSIALVFTAWRDHTTESEVEE